MRDGNPDIEIRLLQTQDVEPIARAFQSVNWDKPVSQYQRYLVETERRSVYMCCAGMSLMGKDCFGEIALSNMESR
jgi:hypothetical protein